MGFQQLGVVLADGNSCVRGRADSANCTCWFSKTGPGDSRSRYFVSRFQTVMVCPSSDLVTTLQASCALSDQCFFLRLAGGFAAFFKTLGLDVTVETGAGDNES